MYLVSRSLYRAALLVALSMIALTAGCHHKPPPPPPPPPVQAPAPARPTVTLQASPSSINKGESATLSWNSTDATELTIAPEVGAVTAQGSTKVTPSDSTTYTITATGPGGSAGATATVTVNAPPPPPPPKGPSDDELFLREVRDAYFDYDKADIRPDARAALSKTGDFLRLGLGWSSSSRFTSFRITFRSISGFVRFLNFSPYATFCATVMCGQIA